MKSACKFSEREMNTTEKEHKKNVLKFIQTLLILNAFSAILNSSYELIVKKKSSLISIETHNFNIELHGMLYHV